MQAVHPFPSAKTAASCPAFPVVALLVLDSREPALDNHQRDHTVVVHREQLEADRTQVAEELECPCSDRHMLAEQACRTLAAVLQPGIHILPSLVEQAVLGIALQLEAVHQHYHLRRTHTLDQHMRASSSLLLQLLEQAFLPADHMRRPLHLPGRPGTAAVERPYRAISACTSQGIDLVSEGRVEVIEPTALSLSPPWSK